MSKVHGAAFVALAVLTSRYLASPWAWGLLGLTGALLTLEHFQVRRVDLAFFRINAVVAFVVFALVWVGI